MTNNQNVPFGVALLPCDISPYRAGNTGIDYITTFDSGVSGPHVMINALTHGNELCGAHALKHLFDNDIQPKRGKLTLGFANVAAYESFDAWSPWSSRFLDEDFNRVWDISTLEGGRKSRELTRAREIRPIIDQIDHLLDIHSVETPQPEMLLAGVRDKGRTLARGLKSPRHIVIDAGHAAGKRLRDYNLFDDDESDRSACLVECGYHFHTSSVSVAIETSFRFLDHFDLLPDETIENCVTRDDTPEQILIEVAYPVTIQTDAFRFVRKFDGFEIIDAEGTLIGHDGAEEVRTPFPRCVMVMPSRSPTKGKTAVRLGRIVA